MTDFLGCYNIFATLSLSLSLSQVLTASHTLLETAGTRARIYGFPWNEPREARFFYPYPTVKVGTATDTRTTNIIYSQIIFQDNRQ